MGGVEHAVKVGFRVWKEAGMDPTRYREAKLDLGERGLSSARYYLPG